MRVALFEDQTQTLEPLTLTRPTFALRCGATTLGHKQLRYFGATRWGALVRPEMEELCRLEFPDARINDGFWLGDDKTVLVNARWLPAMDRWTSPPGSCVGIVHNEIAYVVLSSEQLRLVTPANLADHLEHWRVTLPRRVAGGAMVDYLWNLVDHNPAELCRDFADLYAMDGGMGKQRIHLVGPEARLRIDPWAKVDPLVVVDTTGGPVIVEKGAVISAFTRLEGPCYIGQGTHVLGAKIRAGTTLGPQCRIGGEVETSIVHGHSNKYHDGFLGHSYVGEWVNLGAGTHNSDLRNDYGPVTMNIGGVSVPTGSTKVGCFIGDHTKTGLGTLFNTGSWVGAFCNVLPGADYAPRFLPSFTTWWKGNLREGFRFEQLLNTAQKVMERRGRDLTEIHVSLYQGVYAASALERHKALRASEQLALRKSA